jgi:hypothetical protein
LLSQLEFHTNKHLLLETRLPGEDFPIDTDYNLRVSLATRGRSYEEEPAIDIPLLSTATLKDLKQACSKKFGIPPEKVLILKVIQTTAKVLEGSCFIIIIIIINFYIR